MVNYPKDYDSLGEIKSIEFQDHVGNLLILPHSDLNFPIPSGLTVTWKYGRIDIIIKLQTFGVGMARVAVQDRSVDGRFLAVCVYVARLHIGTYRSTFTSSHSFFWVRENRVHSIQKDAVGEDVHNICVRCCENQ